MQGRGWGGGIEGRISRKCIVHVPALGFGVNACTSRWLGVHGPSTTPLHAPQQAKRQHSTARKGPENAATPPLPCWQSLQSTHQDEVKQSCLVNLDKLCVPLLDLVLSLAGLVVNLCRTGRQGGGDTGRQGGSMCRCLMAGDTCIHILQPTACATPTALQPFLKPISKEPSHPPASTARGAPPLAPPAYPTPPAAERTPTCLPASTWNLQYSITLDRILPGTFGSGIISSVPVSVFFAGEEAAAGRSRDTALIGRQR